MKVQRRRLPIVEPPIPTGGGRIMTSAGELAQIVNGDAYRFLAFVEFRYAGPQSPTRGNHVHRRKAESLYVISGRLRALYEDLESGDRMAIDLEPGDLVTVEPNCAHAYRPLEDALAIEFASVPYDSADTERHVVEEDS